MKPYGLQALYVICLACAGCAATPSAAAPVAVTQNETAKTAPPAAAAATNDAASVPLSMIPAVASAPKPLADLSDMRATGTLRFLLLRATAEAQPFADDVSLSQRMATQLAQSLGLTPQFVVAQSETELLQALTEGRGDVLIAPNDFSAQAPAGTAFSQPVRHTSIVAVVPKDRSVPRKLRDLQKLNVCVLENTPFAQVAANPNYHLTHVHLQPLTVDEDDLLANVGSGACAATVAYADSVARYQEVHDDLQVAFTLQDPIALAWLTRSSSLSLLEAINSAAYEDALSRNVAHTSGDLAAIVHRKVLRVAMMNNGASYYLYRGKEVGFQYDLAALLASRLGVRLEVVVPRHSSDLETLLSTHQVDLAPLPGSVNNPNIVASEPFIYADYVLVQPAGDAPVTSIDQLSGKTLTVRPGSPYLSTLRTQAAAAHIHIVEGPDDQDTVDLIDQVGQKKLPYTVSNSILLGTELAYRHDIQGTFAFASHQPLVYGVRHDAPQLLQRVNRFIANEMGGNAYNAIYARYFAAKKTTESGAAKPEAGQEISPYDAIVRDYGRQYGIDWRLVVAQMYQESRFDPHARSWVGALGLLQIMPETGAHMGYYNLEDPLTNIHAGVQYLASMIASLDPTLDVRQRIRFALAAYNAGLGHVLDARRLARERGLDANRWFGHVEQAMLLLEKNKYARKARHGYCRGSEPVDYVSRIQTKYDDYIAVVPLEPTSAASR